MHLPVCVYWVCQYWPHPSARHDLSDTLRANTLIPLRKKLTNKNYFYCSGLDVKTVAVGSQQSPTSTHQHHCYKAPILRCTWTRKRESTRGNSTAARRGKKGRESEKRAQRSWRSCCGRRADVTGAPKTEAAGSTTRTEGPDLICGTFWRFEQPDTRSVNDGGFFPAVKKKISTGVFGEEVCSSSSKRTVCGGGLCSDWRHGGGGKPSFSPFFQLCVVQLPLSVRADTGVRNAKPPSCGAAVCPDQSAHRLQPPVHPPPRHPSSDVSPGHLNPHRHSKIPSTLWCLHTPYTFLTSLSSTVATASDECHPVFLHNAVNVRVRLQMLAGGCETPHLAGCSR